MSKRGAGLKILPDTRGHDGGLPPRSGKEAAHRMIGKSLSIKDRSSSRLLDPGEGHSETDMGSLDGIPRLLDDTQASTHVSTGPGAFNMAAPSKRRICNLTVHLLRSRKFPTQFHSTHHSYSRGVSVLISATISFECIQ